MALLTPTEKDRLLNQVPDPKLSDKELRKFRNDLYHNNMIVRRKIKTWLEASEDIIFALNHVPISRLRKDISDDEIFRIFHVGLQFITALSFQPVDEIDNEFLVIASSDPVASNIGEIYTRYASEREVTRNLKLKQIAAYLGSFITRKYLWDALQKWRIYTDKEEE
jgi:hypothetical protein